MKISVVLCACVVSAVAAIGCGGSVKVIVPDRNLPKATDWEKRDPNKPLVPENSRYVQVIVTPGEPSGVQFARIFVNGRYLVGYFRFLRGGANELVDQINRLEQQRRFSYAVIFESGGSAATARVDTARRVSPEFGFQPSRGQLPGSTTGLSTGTDGHCDNAGSMPTGGPKGGESLPGEQNDPQASAAYMAASVQGLVQLNNCSYPPVPGPAPTPTPVK